MRVLMAIAQFQQGSFLPTYSTVSYTRIREVTGVGKPDISRAVARLQNDGLLEVVDVSSKGTRYRLNPPPYAYDEAVGSATNPVGILSNPAVGTVSNLSVGNGTNCVVGGNTQPFKKVIIEKNNRQERAGGHQDFLGFKTLWRIWPTKRKQTEAEEMYRRVVACGVGEQVLLSIAESYLRSFEGERQYIPGLARWLDPDDVGGWCEAMKERRAQMKEALLRGVSDEDLEAALAARDQSFARLLRASEDDPLGLVDGRYTNRDVAISYFVRHRQEARDAMTRERLDAAGLVDIKCLPAFD